VECRDVIAIDQSERAGLFVRFSAVDCEL